MKAIDRTKAVRAIDIAKGSNTAEISLNYFSVILVKNHAEIVHKIDHVEPLEQS